jgi:hypothetical protein
LYSGSCLILSRQTKLSIRFVLNGGPWERRHAAGSCFILSRQNRLSICSALHAGPVEAASCRREER